MEADVSITTTNPAFNNTTEISPNTLGDFPNVLPELAATTPPYAGYPFSGWNGISRPQLHSPPDVSINHITNVLEGDTGFLDLSYPTQQEPAAYPEQGFGELSSYQGNYPWTQQQYQGFADRQAAERDGDRRNVNGWWARPPHP
ncbi:unnamed protein product [Dicrocoelium dendriticum]|nr:unnamed protein product [Dicrocoelium dendriticum]